MKKIIFIICFVFCCSIFKAQLLNEGDVTLSPNVGVPHVSAAILKTGLKLYYKSNLENKYTINVKNTPVFNFKAEYFIDNDISLGLAGSYWKMDIDVTDLYEAVTSTLNVSEVQIDNTKIGIQVAAVGVRGSYHFMADDSDTKWDPYFGGTIGVSQYKTNIQFTSTVLGKQLPEKLFDFKKGYSTYFATTLGVRYFFVKEFGINAEIGWDRGALLFGGMVIKFPTKKQKT